MIDTVATVNTVDTVDTIDTVDIVDTFDTIDFCICLVSAFCISNLGSNKEIYIH